MARRTPIYWYFLVHNPLRLALSLCGVSFAVLVMFMEVGFFYGLNDSQAILPPTFNADLVMMNHKKVHLNKWYYFNRSYLYQAFAWPEVAEVIPVEEGNLWLKNPQTGMYNSITVLSFPVGSTAFSLPGMAEHAAALKNAGLVLYDRLSREIYGQFRPGDVMDLGGVKYHLGGLVTLGPSFSRNGYVFMSNAAWLTNHYPAARDRATFGLIRLKPGADVGAVQASMRERLDPEVVVMTPREISQRESDFTTYQTPVGIIFGLGVLVGFWIGVMICYQILFNEITDHLPQYATLKAVGYSNRYLTLLVQKVALLLSLLGFVPGLLAAAGLYALIQSSTRIIMQLDPYRAGLVFALTVLMCLAAGLLAVRKVVEADPADLY